MGVEVTLETVYGGVEGKVLVTVDDAAAVHAPVIGRVPHCKVQFCRLAEEGTALFHVVRDGLQLRLQLQEALPDPCLESGVLEQAVVPDGMAVYKAVGPV